MIVFALHPPSIGQLNQIIIFLSIGLLMLMKAEANPTKWMGWHFIILSAGAAVSLGSDIILNQPLLSRAILCTFLIISLLPYLKATYIFPLSTPTTSLERTLTITIIALAAVYGLLTTAAVSHSWQISLLPFKLIEEWILPGFYLGTGLWIILLYFRQVVHYRKSQNKRWKWRWWLESSGYPKLAFVLSLTWLSWLVIFSIAQGTYDTTYSNVYDFWASCGLLLAGSIFALLYFYFAPEKWSLMIKLSLLYLIAPSFILAWLGLIVPPALRLPLVGFALLFQTVFIILFPYVLRRVMIRPLFRLTNSMQRVNEGDWNTPLLAPSNDEIGYLAESFSGIINRVMMAANALKQANFNLAQKIEEQTKLLVELHKAHHQTLILSRHLVELQEAERRRLAGELHDEIGQALTGLKLTLELGVKTSQSPQIYTSQAQQILSQLIQRVNDISLSLRPVMLDEFGLLSALLFATDQFTKQTGIEVYFQHDGLEGQRFNPEIETAAFRIIQEALTNVARYAQVNKVSVRLLNEKDRLLLEIEDHGVGFDIENTVKNRYSYGIAGMRERVELLGGHFHIDSSPGAGTFVWATIPLSSQFSSHLNKEEML